MKVLINKKKFFNVILTFFLAWFGSTEVKAQVRNVQEVNPNFVQRLTDALCYAA